MDLHAHSHQPDAGDSKRHPHHRPVWAGLSVPVLSARVVRQLLVSRRREVQRALARQPNLRELWSALAIRHEQEARAGRDARGSNLLATAVAIGWLASLIGFGIVFFNFELDHFTGRGTWQATLKLAAAAALACEGLLLATNWRQARMLLLARWLERREAHRSRPLLHRMLWWRLGKQLLLIAGLAWLILAILELERGITTLP
jgi:hypothetical protein